MVTVFLLIVNEVDENEMLICTCIARKVNTIFKYTKAAIESSTISSFQEPSNQPYWQFS